MFGFCVSRNFYIVVVPLKRKSSTIKNLINPDEMDMEEVGYVKESIRKDTWKESMRDVYQTWYRHSGSG